MAGGNAPLGPSLSEAIKGNPYRIGYFSDNEVGWWYGALFYVFISKNPLRVTKQKLLTMFTRRMATTGNGSPAILCLLEWCLLMHCSKSAEP